MDFKGILDFKGFFTFPLIPLTVFEAEHPAIVEVPSNSTVIFKFPVPIFGLKTIIPSLFVCFVKVLPLMVILTVFLEMMDWSGLFK